MGKKNKKPPPSPQSEGSEPSENSSQRENTQTPDPGAKILTDEKSSAFTKRDSKPGKHQIKEQAKGGTRKGDKEQNESSVDYENKHEDENSNIDTSTTVEGEASVQNRKDTVKGPDNQNLQFMNEQDYEESSQRGQGGGHGNEDRYSSLEEGQGKGHGSGDSKYSSEEGQGRRLENEDRGSSQKGRDEGHLNEYHHYSSQEGRVIGQRDEYHEQSSQKGRDEGHLKEYHDYSSHSSQEGRGRGQWNEYRDHLSQEGRGRGQWNEYRDHLSQEGRGRGQCNEYRDHSSQKGRGRGQWNEYRDHSSQKGRGRGQWNEYRDHSSQKGRGRGQWNEYRDHSSQKGRGRGQWNEYHDHSSQEGRDRGQWNEYRDHSLQEGRGRGQWNEYRDHSSQEGRGRGQWNEYHDHSSQEGRGRGQQKEYSADSLQQGQNTQESYADKISKQNRNEFNPKIRAALTCSGCNSFYNCEHRKPKCLKCGHTICSECAGRFIHRSILGCPDCREPTSVHSPKDLQDNIELMRMLRDNKGLLKTSSPHGSRCYEQGIPTTHYCAKCERWVCKSCGDADHLPQRACKLIPAGEALKRMKSKCECDGLRASKIMSDALNEIRSYQGIIKSCLNIMRAAHESFTIEETHAQNTLAEGEAKVEALKKAVSSFPEDGDIKKAQAAKMDVEGQCWDIQDRRSAPINNVKFIDDFRKISKKLLNLTAYLHANSASGKPPPLAQVTTSEGIRYAKLIAESGRVHAYSVQNLSPENGTRAIPMEDVKALIDSSSALLFLDLHYGGRVQGRVYIRTMGDTKRGRLFQSLCLGDLGHTHKNTGFHRIWWTGSKGEHIWGGDYDRGDGSGGAAFFALDENLPPAAVPRPIVKGLVAGRYEKEGISTLFRIYTRSAEEGSEEAAFGIVEHGLDVVAGAVGRGNVRDIKIVDCGMVIEGQGLD
ncbi:uncharacterized protein LOC125035291 [Penaeus chinensis]|uniref:uncharacterized protein LOC125035291 n=1 Tax=Penaeus chinensis TaxID=139456 RepID=UPI001FB59FBF|nr:uncharacterized protein LOC125035291 [Penaeus chinensis]